MTFGSVLVFAAIALGCLACGKDRSVGASTDASPDASPAPVVTGVAPSMIWRDFHGVEFLSASEAHVSEKDGVMPGPGGMGGIPPGERPSATVTLAGPRGFYVQIEKTKDPVSPDGMKRVIVGMKMGTNIVTKTTANTWEITYARTDAADAEPPNAHILYFDIAGGHYQCTYADVNCGDRAAADAICRSLRAKKN